MALPTQTNCSVIMVVPVARGLGVTWASRTPHFYTAQKAVGKGNSDWGSLGTAWRTNRIGPSSHSSRLPSGGTMSTEPGRPLAFHYQAYESSSPGKYVAIKINRPALSAEHNANYLWAVCAIFIIVQAPALSAFWPTPPALARGGRRRTQATAVQEEVWAPEYRLPRTRLCISVFQAQRFTLVSIVHC